MCCSQDVLRSMLHAETIEHGLEFCKYEEDGSGVTLHLAAGGTGSCAAAAAAAPPPTRHHMRAPSGAGSADDAASNDVSSGAGGGGSSHQPAEDAADAVPTAAGRAAAAPAARVVRAKFLVACDGPFSPIRQQALGDGPPAFDSTVRWTGRLQGNQVSTIPGDYHAYWVKDGHTFNCHPLPCGDVAWEAVMHSSALAALGWRWDHDAHSVVRITGQQAAAGQQQQQKDAAADDVRAKLQQLYAAFPRAVGHIISLTPQEAILEAGIFVRSAAQTPPAMGKGRVVIIGEAAHPMRLSGHQEENLALEDAAELGACVMQCRGGKMSRDSMRAFERRRRVRWRHVMAIAAAQGSAGTAGVSILQGLLAYISDLYVAEFVPLAGPRRRALQHLGLGRAMAGCGRLAARLLSSVAVTALAAGGVAAGVVVSRQVRQRHAASAGASDGGQRGRQQQQAAPTSGGGAKTVAASSGRARGVVQHRMLEPAVLSDSLNIEAMSW